MVGSIDLTDDQLWISLIWLMVVSLGFGIEESIQGIRREILL